MYSALRRNYVSPLFAARRAPCYADFSARVPEEIARLRRASVLKGAAPKNYPNPNIMNLKGEDNMRKVIILTSILALVIVLSAAMAQDPHSPPPPGPPPPSWGPGPHPGGGPWAGPPGEPGMGPENRREMWERFRREHPEDAQAIMNLIQKYPELRMMILGGGRISGPPPGAPPGRMARTPQDNPEHFERMQKVMNLREQAINLAERYLQTTDAQQKKKIEADLKKLLDEMYELRLAEMKYRVDRAEKYLAQVKEDLGKYQKDRNSVIESWFKQLMGREEDYKIF
jgi:hypothetical protein